MSKKFKLEITLGNDAMQTPEDVADTLLSVASQLQSGRHDGAVFDINGNTVGTFSLR